MQNGDLNGSVVLSRVVFKPTSDFAGSSARTVAVDYNEPGFGELLCNWHQDLLLDLFVPTDFRSWNVDGVGDVARFSVVSQVENERLITFLKQFEYLFS